MNGFYMTDLRTPGMAPSEINAALYNREISPCPYAELKPSDVDEILEGFLYRGTSVHDKTPRTMSVLNFGTSWDGMPLASIQIATPSHTIMATPAVCTYCPWSTCCDESMKFDMHDFLYDDPVWNADILDDEDDD